MKTHGAVFATMMAALVATPWATSAQSHALDRGGWAVGGGGSLVSSKTDGQDDRRTTLSLAPEVLYFVTPGLGIGGSLGYSYGSQGERSGTSIAVGPRVSYYLGGSEASWHPFASLTAGWGRNRADDGQVTRTVDETMVSARVGLLHLLESQVGLTLAAFWESRDRDHEMAPDDELAGVEVGLQVFLR